MKAPTEWTKDKSRRTLIGRIGPLEMVNPIVLNFLLVLHEAPSQWAEHQHSGISGERGQDHSDNRHLLLFVLDTSSPLLWPFESYTDTACHVLCSYVILSVWLPVCLPDWPVRLPSVYLSIRPSAMLGSPTEPIHKYNSVHKSLLLRNNQLNQQSMFLYTSTSTPPLSLPLPASTIYWSGGAVHSG